MRRVPSLIASSLLLCLETAAPAFAPAPVPKPARNWDWEKIEKEYGGLAGRWSPVDSKSPLNYLWLHQNGKAPGAGVDGSPWRLHLCFDTDTHDNYAGAPARVTADAGRLTIALQPPGMTKRGTNILHISRDGDRILLRIVGGRFDGVHALRRGSAKR